MKALLMFKDRDFNAEQRLPSNEEALVQDLQLDMMFSAMARKDTFLQEVVKKAVLFNLNDVSSIVYRQEILKDCLKYSPVVREIYGIAVESIERERKQYFSFLGDYPDSTLHRSIEVLQVFVEMLKKLRAIADQHESKFESAGFGTFFSMLKRELGDEYFASIDTHLKYLKFRNGVLISTSLGKGGKGRNYTLRRVHPVKGSWLKRIFAQKPPSYTYYVDSRDESGGRALSELRDRGINLVANALAQSTDHILSFFSMLRTELAFYIGCVNLHQQLAQGGALVSFPVPVARGESRLSCQGLYDLCLALTSRQKIVGNDVSADNKQLLIITGANQGGKSTFLRSVGLAQLMMQCGMFVPAASFSSTVCDAVFTHYKREEDATMKSGKFDEELSRMNDIVDHLTPNCLLTFNESFAATNEREGSEIARQIISALLEKGIKILFVTHLYECAHGYFEKRMENALFLRAERQMDGSRTFKLIEGEPLQTSYGEDLYDKIFRSEKGDMKVSASV
jgi:DNA mismatch repair ATPase MutS